MAWPAAAAAKLDVVYPNLPERPPEAYGYRLLQLALEHAGCDCRPRIAAAQVSALRAAQVVFSGEANVLDVGPGLVLERGADLLPFPLDQGLSGCRLFLVRKDLLPRLDEVRNLSQLRQFSFGQGEGWSDVWVLRTAGLRVETAQFVPLFRMLEARRFDILPLGADEAQSLLTRYQAEAPSVVIAASVAFHYPFARVFAIPHGQDALRATLMLGLQRAFDSGAMKRLLSQQPGLGPLVAGTQRLPERVITLAPPDAPKVLAEIPARYLHPSIRAIRGLGPKPVPGS